MATCHADSSSSRDMECYITVLGTGHYFSFGSRLRSWSRAAGVTRVPSTSSCSKLRSDDKADRPSSVICVPVSQRTSSRLRLANSDSP